MNKEEDKIPIIATPRAALALEGMKKIALLDYWLIFAYAIANIVINGLYEYLPEPIENFLMIISAGTIIVLAVSLAAIVTCATFIYWDYCQMKRLKKAFKIYYEMNKKLKKIIKEPVK